MSAVPLPASRRDCRRVCVVRADASRDIGIGHITRSRTLAEALAGRGWLIAFAVRTSGGLGQSLRRVGNVIRIPTSVPAEEEPQWLGLRLKMSADLCITDSYLIGAEWHGGARVWANTVVAFDDIATRMQGVDVLINQNPGWTMAHYRGLVPPGAKVMLGPKYAIIRPEFRQLDTGPRLYEGGSRRVLVFLGGADSPNVTMRAASACMRVGIDTDVVIGPSNPHGNALRRWAATRPRITIHQGELDMAQLMSRADLSIGAPGSASWERCLLGLPTILVVLAANQRRIADALVRRGCAISLGEHQGVDVVAIEEAVRALAGNRDKLVAMSSAAKEVTDGLGTQRVVAAVEKQCRDSRA